ncbi:hypothetical protein HanXRQr2_Chr09g0396631 [Helianthus annuus]|uniref:Uncharacterized protein n=1 Tax=Helianthus annuus TaxID=4232 RepID=A0A9K3N9H9_HELAN|nr:hypothetical protein HanXRQr2_Chr09g0396631 [Helianthus annuus]
MYRCLKLLDSKVTQLVKKILLCRGTFISYSYAAESMRMQWVECWINIFYPQTRSIVNPTSLYCFSFRLRLPKSFSRPKCKQDIHPIGIIWDLVMLCQEVR